MIEDQLKECRQIIQIVIKAIEKKPSSYNKNDIRNILIGKLKEYPKKHKFKISLPRLSGLLDALEALDIIQRNNKGLYSTRRAGKETLEKIEFEG